VGGEIELELRKFVAPEFIFGSGARHLAGRYAGNYGARKVLVVTDSGVSLHGWTAEVVKSLASEGLDYTIFDNVTPNPKAEEVMAGSRFYTYEHCDSIVAVGGGSPMDCAKGIGIVSTNGGHILDYEGVDKVECPLPPLIFVPTTAGTSADVSQFAIITDTVRKVKIAIVTKTIVPDVALIDPETTTTMDGELTAHTGLDAFCHSFEAFASNAHSPITDIHALEAVRLISEALPQVVNDLQDMQLRGKMMLASLFAGLAFSNASLGAVHAMAHSLGGLLDLPHGACNAILLEHVVGFNFKSAAERYRRVAKAMGLDLESLDDEKAGIKMVNRLGEIRRSVGVHASLRDLGMTKHDIGTLASNSLSDPCIVTNPTTATLTDIEKIYERAL
jgi:alcohol dehydrogenase